LRGFPTRHAGRVAANDDEFRALLRQKTGNLNRKTADFFLRSRAVRLARSVTDIKHIFVRKKSSHFLQHGQPTWPGVKNAYRRVWSNAVSHRGSSTLIVSDN